MSRKTKIAVLGAGRVGAAMALDLAADPDLDVLVADRDGGALAPLAVRGIATREADLGGPALEEVIAGSQLVVGAVPGFLGFSTARRVLAAGRDLVDISFFPEDAFALDGFARERGAMALVDCGVAPGLSNLLLGAMAARMDRVESFVCYVGGLPARPAPPWEYKAPFSPIDVLEEYTRPARYVRGGSSSPSPPSPASSGGSSPRSVSSRPSSPTACAACSRPCPGSPRCASSPCATRATSRR
ncbi:MAG: saccharopine dehydrogenase NADP-binding domain-containing protein [Thermoanaerobaculia bacterium]|nr:saccharopine dehydrogenase NADP-binding domain-containing protein [Thermoanaerobaculia bacterium]